MPILIRNCGVNKDVTILEFGNGDIGVSTGVNTKENFVIIAFTQIDKGAIDRDVPIADNQTTETITDLKAVMYFNSPKSIQVVIDALKDIQQTLIHNTPKPAIRPDYSRDA